VWHVPFSHILNEIEHGAQKKSIERRTAIKVYGASYVVTPNNTQTPTYSVTNKRQHSSLVHPEGELRLELGYVVVVQWNKHGRNTSERLVLNTDGVERMESITSIHVCNSFH
jgi:hypothetical protein